MEELMTKADQFEKAKFTYWRAEERRRVKTWSIQNIRTNSSYICIFIIVLTLFCSSDYWNRKLGILSEGFYQGTCFENMWASWCKV
jgi:hypothetical protein